MRTTPKLALMLQGVIISFAVIVGLIASPVLAQASLCETIWDGQKIFAAIADRPLQLSIPLKDRHSQVHEVTVAQLQAFSDANDRITRAAGLSPRFVICTGSDPNAFATRTQNGEIVGVTVGMLRMADGDRDMAAAVLGHELAHHTKQHASSAATRRALIGLAAIILGAAADARSQRRTGVATGIGVAIGQIGGELVSRKFDRDQEREADEVGFQYLVSAGFDPMGAVRMAERLNSLGSGSGLFFASHPGWPERTERFRTMIAESAQARELIAINENSQESGSTTVASVFNSSGAIAREPQQTNSILPSSTQSLTARPALAAFAHQAKWNYEPPPLPKRGKFEINAERAAAAENCPVNKPVSLTDSGPGFEEFMVYCPNGETLAVRCDFGTCRAVK